MSLTTYMNARALVTHVDNNGFAKVVVERSNACGGCGGSEKASSCRSCISGSQIQTRVFNAIDAKQGDIVSVSLNTASILKGAAALYLIPVAGFLTGALLGSSFHQAFFLSETAASLTAGIIGLVTGFFITRKISSQMAENQGMTPMISKIIFSGSNMLTIGNGPAFFKRPEHHHKSV